MTLYQKIAEKLQFISPEFYKKRYFKKLEELSADNFSEKNMEPELLWIKDYIPKAAVFFDIGANVGTYLFRLEKRLSPHQIYAFEPNPKLYFRLKRIFPEMHIYRLALSDKNETADFKIPVINGETYNSRGTLHTQFFENGEENHFTEKVKVMKLDDWAGLENLKRLDFIKIDV
ncbi:MAG TPA: FkbM family methyltransferase, partial [Kaistella sp.]|nr:FkbM family methyltransferase [Kaistella sp.]